jgi:hypothetical protein
MHGVSLQMLNGPVTAALWTGQICFFVQFQVALSYSFYSHVSQMLNGPVYGGAAHRFALSVQFKPVVTPIPIHFTITLSHDVQFKPVLTPIRVSLLLNRCSLLSHYHMTQMLNGPVYGGAAYWTGLLVAVDTYNNDNQGPAQQVCNVPTYKVVFFLFFLTILVCLFVPLAVDTYNNDNQDPAQ